MKSVYILGVGHNTPVFMDLALSCGYEIAGLYHYDDTRTGESVHGVKIQGSTEYLLAQNSLKGMNFMLSMGDNSIRSNLAETLKKRNGTLPNFIHPSAIISKYSSIGKNQGICICAFSHIQANSSIGKNTIILSGVIITHNVIIGSNCLLADKCFIGAHTIIHDHVFVGTGALSISSKVNTIGDHAYIGAGALLTKNVPPHSKIAGFPGRVIS